MGHALQIPNKIGFFLLKTLMVSITVVVMLKLNFKLPLPCFVLQEQK